MNWFFEKWNTFWYAPASPINLGVSRALYCLFMAQYTWFFDRFSRYWFDLPEIWWTPNWLMSFFEYIPVTVDQYLFLHTVLAILFLLSGLGVFTRWSLFFCAILATFIYAARASFMEPQHDNLVVAPILWVFALSKSGDAFALDRIWKKRNFQLSGEYTWPIKLLCLLCVSYYTSAGVSKIVTSGWEWLWGDTLLNYFIFSYYKTDTDWIGLFLGVGLFFAQFPLLCKIGGAFTIFVEVIQPFAIFNKWLRRIFVPLMVLLQFGFHVTCANGFFNMIAVFFSWMNWEFLFKKLNWFQSKSSSDLNKSENKL